MTSKTRWICILLASLTALGGVGCSKKPPAGGIPESTVGETVSDRETDEDAPTNDIEVLDLKEIQYEMTQTTQKVGENVRMTLPAGEVVTGKRVAASVKLDVTVDNYNYFIVDWGDGTWSYNGPYVYHQTGEVYHTYKTAGTYQVKACAVNMSSGKLYGWTEAQTLTVSGVNYTGNMIKGVAAIGSSNAGEGFEYDNIIDDNNTTRWQSKQVSTNKEEEYIGLLFDDYYTMDTLEVKFPADMDTFPFDISIEYTTDGGETWYMFPRYYYVLPNSEGYYQCNMNFPNPKGATLSLPLEGIAANGIRFTCKRYGRKGRTFGVEEMRVYGEKGTLLYTSYDGYYDADLTNMWTIFGLAATETYPRDSIFRSGEKCMMGSLEWAHWDGIQWNWPGDEAMLARHAGAMIGAVYGGDGWYYDEESGKYVVDESEYATNPRNDGFIWATGGAPKHLDEQNHYTNNSSLIIAARDYILTGNADVEAFLSATNGRGQVMLDKLRKAMEYMLVDLNGESGLMTIYDPRNDGTVRGLSSNYWDSLNFFGYNSAYENVFFYQSVLAMADIEEYLGNVEDAAYYRELGVKIKATFNDYFWDPVKGRYITSVNVKGDVLDFGLTIVNFMAVSAGLASEQQAKLIYDWVDGKRIIEGDNSTGADIYNFKVSARTNTVAVETIEEDGLHYWWYNGHDFNDVLPGHWGVYGQQMQNGGTIFYTSYYDVAGRTFLSGDLAMERFNVIMDEFHIDSLRRDPRTQWGFYLVSINGEFPESGLVPATFVTDIVGIKPDVPGLRIQGCLPADLTYAGINEYHFGGKVYKIEVNKSLSEASMTADGDTFMVKVPAGKIYYITRDNQLVAEEDLPQNTTTADPAAPEVTPAEQVVNVDGKPEDVILSVAYHTGQFVSLRCNGVEMDKEHYTRRATCLTLNGEFLKSLPRGKNTFVLTTDVGQTEFVLNIEREGIALTDGTRMKKFTGTDISFAVDFGSRNMGDILLNGERLPAGTYSYQDGKLLIHSSYLSTLELGVYELLVYDQAGDYVDCVITVGLETEDVHVVNFDSFTSTGGNFNLNEVKGLRGAGGGVVCNGSGMLFQFGGGNPSYELVPGKTYSVSMYLKFDHTVSGTSGVLDIMTPIRSPFVTGGYADLLYFRYNDQDGYYLHKCGYAHTAELVREGDWYRLSFTFTYDASWTTLDVPVWMKTSFTVDNFVIHTVAD